MVAELAGVWVDQIITFFISAVLYAPGCFCSFEACLASPLLCFFAEGFGPFKVVLPDLRFFGMFFRFYRENRYQYIVNEQWNILCRSENLALYIFYYSSLIFIHS